MYGNQTNLHFSINSLLAPEQVSILTFHQYPAETLVTQKLRMSSFGINIRHYPYLKDDSHT